MESNPSDQYERNYKRQPDPLLGMNPVHVLGWNTENLVSLMLKWFCFLIINYKLKTTSLRGSTTVIDKKTRFFKDFFWWKEREYNYNDLGSYYSSIVIKN